MTLARRYHLQGTLVALVVLALLFLWKNMVSLVPPTPLATDTRREISCRDATARRDLSTSCGAECPRVTSSQTCITQWRAANALPGGKIPNAEKIAARLNSIVGSGGRLNRSTVGPIVAAYHAACAVLKRRGVDPKR